MRKGFLHLKIFLSLLPQLLFLRKVHFYLYITLGFSLLITWKYLCYLQWHCYDLVTFQMFHVVDSWISFNWQTSDIGCIQVLGGVQKYDWNGNRMGSRRWEMFPTFSLVLCLGEKWFAKSNINLQMLPDIPFLFHSNIFKIQNPFIK